MGLVRFLTKTPGIVAFLARSFLCIIGLLLTFSKPACKAFNLDVENPAVYSGPNGSYFGYAVDFYLSDSGSASVLVGAPKARTKQFNVTEGGSVFYCPWSSSQTDCHAIKFDLEGDRNVLLNDTNYQADFKSHQWFGATVRSHGDTILACAPLYSWRTKEDIPHSDATGSCYLSVENFTNFVEYAPCRTEISGPSGQGYCQGGFSAEFTKDGKVVLGGPGSYFWQGQVISAAKEDIIRAYYPGYFIQAVSGQIQTKQAHSLKDDSYQGYSVAAGEFSGDGVEGKSTNQVADTANLTNMTEYTGEQMGSYFGYAVATTDINSDGMVDLLVGAPMLMVRSSHGRLEEMGQVYVYLQRSPLKLESRLPLTGTQVFGRFGSTIAPLGDLNLDGFNDVAISCPFGGEDQQGLVYIYNGYSEGLRQKPSQVIRGQWAAGTIPASFGFALRGAKDLDMNGYPDLIVGAFGINKAILYRSRPIVNTSASLTVSPTMINPEEKNCILTTGNSSIPVEVQLDSHKHKQKGAVKRALFLDSQQPLLPMTVRLNHGQQVCQHKRIYLRDEKEFRDKLSSIYVALNFSLDPKAAADSHVTQLIIWGFLCFVFLFPWVLSDRKEVYLGDDNSLTLTFNARNEGEGGAYEADLYVVLPPEADYIGIARNNETLTQLTCSYETENQTRYLSCDLGNPMKSGTNVGLIRSSFFSILCFHSKNENNSHSEVVASKLEVIVKADVILQGVSRPDKVFFPPANWKLTKNYNVEVDVGPAVEHIYELVNNGPSRISHTLLELRCPFRVQGQTLLYPLEFSTEGPINCTADKNMNHRNLKVSDIQMNTSQGQMRQSQRVKISHHFPNCSTVDCWKVECNVGLLQKGTTAILKMRSRVWAETFTEVYILSCHPQVVTPVVWNKPDIENSVPLWIIILAILAGLLLLALLIYILYRVSTAVI
uniref:Integrin alpha-2 domain-containing protein n=1 Tax=Astatotilapia calliptera TaxID=8154 RepID=A0AAX7UNE8_ASTCA